MFIYKLKNMYAQGIKSEDRIYSFKFCLCLIGIALAISACSQSKPNKLIGRWAAVKVELRSGETGENLTWNKQPYPADDTIHFIDERKVFETKGYFTSNYRLQGANLFWGNRKFLVEKLTENELVLLADDDPTDSDPFRTYYSKVKKNN